MGRRTQPRPHEVSDPLPRVRRLLDIGPPIVTVARPPIMIPRSRFRDELLRLVHDWERRYTVGVEHACTAEAAGPQPYGDPLRQSGSRQLNVHNGFRNPVGGLDTPLDGVLGRVEDAGRDGGPVDRVVSRRDRAGSVPA